MNYVEVIFGNVSEPDRDLLVGLLSAKGFDGFHEDNAHLRAYISGDEFSTALLDSDDTLRNFPYSINLLGEQNWNAVWESNFDPVVVDEFCAIRAEFHQPIPYVSHEIIITPKMSFGTGHHATTYMMIARMKDLDFRDRQVLDFGTGTGVLAILASQRGATHVVAIDNDEWSIENARENFVVNGVTNVELLNSNTPEQAGMFDVILANVTRNVIVEHFDHFAQQLNAGGSLLLSGLLEDDESEISSLAREHGLAHRGTSRRDKWICLEFATITYLNNTLLIV